MSKRSTLFLVSALLAGGLLMGCQAEPPAPEKPTWVDDVLPILRANCFSCHGATAPVFKYGIVRWDVYDLKALPIPMMDEPTPSDMGMRFADVGFVESLDPADPMGVAVAFTGASKHAAVIKLEAALPADDPGRMPPAPATPLSAHDVDVLTNWLATGAALGKRVHNAKPTIHWLNKPKTFEVLDDDGDQVLGTMDCDGTAVSIKRSGVSSLPSGTTLPCAVKMSDGFDSVTATLK